MESIPKEAEKIILTGKVYDEIIYKPGKPFDCHAIITNPPSRVQVYNGLHYYGYFNLPWFSVEGRYGESVPVSLTFKDLNDIKEIIIYVTF